MIYLNNIFCVVLLILCTAIEAWAYEEEDAVPLAIRVQAGDGNVIKTAIRLSGRNVEIRSEIRNDANSQKRLGFAAYTPFFDQLGDGEEHIDKTFTDLKVDLNGKSLKLLAYRRGFFLGQDVTDKLSTAGIAPLPNTNIDEEKLKRLPSLHGLALNNWQGYISYSWIASLPANSTNWQAIRYKALPQFERDEISSDRFSQRVLQHCGNPNEIRKYLADLNLNTDALLVEKYELAVQLVKTQEVSIKIEQPTKNWLGVRPVISLVCGISDRLGNRVSYSGTLSNVGRVTSVLIISTLNQLSEK
ncbi:hypothetical protein [Undibacterium sp. Ren11W]|uniref:hypothetical protein n=1 Tax=Undibacterium sp. Ren11W TaxID=3413045 RepID=UPI003BF153F8